MVLLMLFGHFCVCFQLATGHLHLEGASHYFLFKARLGSYDLYRRREAHVYQSYVVQQIQLYR